MSLSSNQIANLQIGYTIRVAGKDPVAGTVVGWDITANRIVLEMADGENLFFKLRDDRLLFVTARRRKGLLLPTQ